MKSNAAISLILLVLLLPARNGWAACLGDCDGNRTVTVDELLLGADIALGTVQRDQCPNFDPNNDLRVTIDELLAGVSNALSGCPSPPTPTRTPAAATPTPTPAGGPTPGGNCSTGTWQVTFANVGATNATTSDLTLDFVSGTFIGPIWKLEGFRCPLSGFSGADRSIQISYLASGGVQVGSYSLTPGPLTSLLYSETAPPNTLRIWSASSGTLVIDAVEGKRLTFHVVDAAMGPSTFGSTGGPPTGNFTLNITGVVEQIGP